MPYKIALAFFSFALASSIAFADNDPNRDVTCAASKIGVTQDQFRACFLPVQAGGDDTPLASPSDLKGADVASRQNRP
jgi:hypothetical protein